MIRRTAPLEIVSPDLPGVVIRCRRLTRLECGRLKVLFLDPGTDPESLAAEATFLSDIGFVFEAGGRVVTEREFLLNEEAETTLLVYLAILNAQRPQPPSRPVDTPAPPPPTERPLVSPE